VSHQSRDPWRFGALERLGRQFRELERKDRAVRAKAAGRRRRRIAISGGLAAGLVAVFALVLAGRVADALSPINRAPAAAAASESVRFSSTITITVNGGQPYGRFTGHGEIDFARRNYRTRLELGHGEAIEQRRVDGILYIAQLPGGRSQHAPIRWQAAPLAHEASTTFASAPESEEFTNPLVLLDELGGTRALVKVIGTEGLDGVPTILYRLQTNLASLLSASRVTRSEPSSYRAVGATLTVWLDRHGRPRRVDETVAGASSAGAASITTVTDFTAYGQPVAVGAPRKISVRSKRSIVAPSPLAASPSRSFERLLFAHP
jgi:hypothetical protein